MEIREVSTLAQAIGSNIGKVIFGKDAEIERPKALQGRKANKAFLKG